MDKQIHAATVKELLDWPDVTMTQEGGKKHSKVFIHYKGESRLVVVSNTPSDMRAVPNHLSVLRKELRALGAQRKHVVVGGKPKKPDNPVITKSQLEAPMPKQNKLDTIFQNIGDLRYSEMLNLAGFLRDVATAENLRRGQVQSWASTLQSAVDHHAAPRDSDASLAENAEGG